MATLYPLMEGIVALFLIAGGTFGFIGSLGLVRFQDFFTRQHGPSKTSTLGVGCVLIASMGYFTLTTGTISLQELLITIFLFITVPVSAHMLAKSGLHRGLPRDPRTQGNPHELEERGHTESSDDKSTLTPPP